MSEGAPEQGQVREEADMTTGLDECSISRHPHAFISKAAEPILIRPLAEKRRAQLVQMYLDFEPKASFGGLPPTTDDACVKWAEGLMASGLNLAAMAFDQGVVGHAGLFAIDEKSCEMLIVVSPAYQNTGIGTELVRCSIQVCHELGFESIWSCIESANLRARHMCQKCGFQHLTSGYGEVEMGLDLRRYHDPDNTTVQAVMNRHVTTVFRDWSCRAALTLFLENPVGALPVVNERCEVVGILSQTDLLLPANLDRKIGEMLTRKVITVKEGCPLTKVIRLFQSRKTRCIPVVNDDMRLVGIVTRKDILAYYSR
ncbi:MAG: GNAT family N-acetyltransferase [Planctomycetota bacterium]